MWIIVLCVKADNFRFRNDLITVFYAQAEQLWMEMCGHELWKGRLDTDLESTDTRKKKTN